MATTFTNVNTVTEKQGDTLILSGKLKEATPLDAGFWSGAVAVLNMVTDDAARTAVVTAGPVTINTGVTPKTYNYRGTMPAVGTYLYEVQVTGAGSTVRTWPSDGSKYRLEVVPQLG